jgi:hypothetical protein
MTREVVHVETPTLSPILDAAGATVLGQCWPAAT